MQQLLPLLIGALISIMITLNGDLTQVFGTYYAAVIIHIVGVCFAYLLCLLRKEKIRFNKNVPFWAYLGGAIGVFSTLFNNFAFGKISMTSIIALGLFGQSFSSSLIDSFGWLGMVKQPFRKSTVLGFIFSCLGIAIMLDQSVATGILAVILSIAAGVTVVLSRVVNSSLAKETSALVGSFFNHLVGLPLTVLFALLLSYNYKISFGLNLIKPWMFFGGILGVLVVYLFNVVVPRVSSFQLTLLSFVGQVFTGVIIDLLYGQSFSDKLFLGGIIIALGLFTTMILDYLSLRIKRNRVREFN